MRYGASVGTGSIVLPGVTIGRFAMVGAGAVVSKDVPDYALVLGVPARLVGFVCACGEKLAGGRAAGEAACRKCARPYRFVESPNGVRCEPA